ncbi:14911_t:CDS:2, partial [Gigaspora rosea]
LGFSFQTCMMAVLGGQLSHHFVHYFLAVSLLETGRFLPWARARFHVSKLVSGPNQSAQPIPHLTCCIFMKAKSKYFPILTTSCRVINVIDDNQFLSIKTIIDCVIIDYD